MKTQYELTIEKYSDYNAIDPYWIDLHRSEFSKVDKKRISDSLNKYFEKHGPDANEAYDSCQGPLMSLQTAQKALLFALRECRIKSIEIDNLIDGSGSLETDCRENDPVTGRLLHAIPVDEDSAIDEIDCLIQQDKLSKDDWVWLDFASNSFGGYNSSVTAKLRQLTRKHR